MLIRWRYMGGESEVMIVNGKMFARRSLPGRYAATSTLEKPE
jgi:hypothetical protein